MTDAVVRPPRERDSSWWRTTGWWLVSLVVALLHNGLWATPNLGFVALIARNPGSNPFGEGLAGDYLLTDVSLTRLAWLTGQTQPHEVARLHLVVLLVAWAATVALARLRFGHRSARTLTVLLAASPLVTVSMQWLGQPDPLTGACGIAMVLVRRSRSVVALGVLAGITHPEQALFMAATAGLVRCFLPPTPGPAGSGAPTSATPDPGPPPGAGWSSRVAGWAASVSVAVGGVLAGWLAVQLWFALADITLSTPRSDYLDYGLSAFAEHHLTHPAGLLWTLWGPLWLVIIGVVAVESRRRGDARRAWAVMAVLALLALAPVFVTLDETRVYAVITAPLLAAAAAWIPRSVKDPALAAASAVLLVLTAALPGGFATGTTSWRPQLDTPAMAAFLVDGSVDGTMPEETEITPWLLGPFDLVIPDPPQ